MSKRQTLQLFESLLDAADRHAPEDVLVLPVVHDAIGPEETLLGALCEAFDGTYVSSGDRGEGAAGPLNEPLARVVQATFGRIRYPMTIEQRGDAVIASLDDHANPEGGLATALRAVELLVSDEINRPLCVLSYPLAGLDEAVAAALWEICGLAIRTNAPSELRIFVPLADGDVDVDRHCVPNNPVRFAVQRDRLVRRGDARALDDAIRTLLLRPDQALVLFLGAGASVSANLRLGDAIRDEALTALVGQHATVGQRLQAFREYLDQKDRWRSGEKDLPMRQFASQVTLERVLLEAFHTLGGRDRQLLPVIERLETECAQALMRLPPGRKALRHLAEKLPKLIIVSINFDRLIEDGMAVKHEVLITPEDFEQHRDLVVARVKGETDVLPILKLHGSIEDASTLVADIATTERGLHPKTAATLDAMLAANDGPLTWTWIGCSMRDADLAAWLRSHDSADLYELWVDPLPGESLLRYAKDVRQREWASMDQTLDDRLVTEKADVFLRRLDEYVDRLIAARTAP